MSLDAGHWSVNWNATDPPGRGLPLKSPAEKTSVLREIVWVAKRQSLTVTEHFTVSEATSQCHPAVMPALGSGQNPYFTDEKTEAPGIKS